MKYKKNLEEYGYSFNKAINLPMHLVKGEDVIATFPKELKSINVLDHYIRTLLSLEASVDYIITKRFIYYGVIKVIGTDFSLLIGPVASTKHSLTAVKEVMRESHIDMSLFRSFTDFFQQLPLYSFSNFLNILSYVHLTINDQHIPVEQLSKKMGQEIDILGLDQLTDNYFSAKEEGIIRKSYFVFGEEYLHYIEQGNLKKLMQLFKQPIILHTGVLAEDSIRQKKNLAIINTALSTRAAIKGGVDIEVAYQLHDIYIQEIERTFSYSTLNSMQTKIIYDFALRVQESQHPFDYSSRIKDAIQYINFNTNKTLSVSDVASHVELSRTYFSKKFKDEVGMSVNSYINLSKLNEAKNLLTFSNKPIIEISNDLSFSSQSYFQRVFKKEFNMTPKQYRDINQKV